MPKQNPLLMRKNNDRMLDELTTYATTTRRFVKMFYYIYYRSLIYSKQIY